MASMPPQPPRQNTSSSSHQQPHAETSSQAESTAFSMVSEDSQTVLLDNHASSTNNEEQTEASQPRPHPLSRSSTLGIKRCWICIGESTEDDPVNPPKWRSPCSCNLTAHEACLLDWVADLEDPRSRRSGPSKKIQCPQCKSEIKIARPKSLDLAVVRAWERLIGTATLPGMAAVLGGTVWAGCFYHGLHSVSMVFGEPQARYIYMRASRHSGWLSGYALIPLSLISARTNYADFVLPGGTVFLFATQLTERFAIDWTIWPPRPSTVFGCLPLVRNCYNYLYEKAFGNLNRRWLQEIQPRQAQDGNDVDRNGADAGDQAAAAADEIADGDVVLELNLEIGVEEGEDGEQQERQQHQRARDDGGAAHQEALPPDHLQRAADPGPHPVVDEAEAAPQNPAPVNANADQAENAPGPALLNRRPNEIISDTSSIFFNTLGALAFPSIAAGMGEILYRTLPSSWVLASSRATILSNNGREQLLRTKWGRSVVGGCLFVVLKDALVLYVRWRMARNHRGRRVMDWDKQKGEYVLAK